MKVVLLCNYRPDAQQSMLRFGDLLARSLPHRGIEIEIVAPSSRLGGWCRRAAASRAGRWLGYIDKYLLFPLALRQTLRSLAHRRDTLIHIVDHSNALYIPDRSPLPWIATCHDLLAVRGALGEDTDCPASFLGRLLQKRIVLGLSRADAVASVSTSTRTDVDRLIPLRPHQERLVIPLALNHPYRPRTPAETSATLSGVLPPAALSQPFLLHVGSNLARKNKAGILRVFLRLAAEGWPGHLVFCGAALPGELSALVAASGHASRIHAVPRADDAQLEALYARAHALLFPSRCEGFGWPVIEAQACDCPVICSDRTSLPEIGGDAALVHSLDDEAGMAASVLRLHDPVFRADLLRRGRDNLRRFTLDRLLDSYVGLYTAALRARFPAQP